MQLAAYQASATLQLTALAHYPAFAYEGLWHYSGGPRSNYGHSILVHASLTEGYYGLLSRSGSLLTVTIVIDYIYMFLNEKKNKVKR